MRSHAQKYKRNPQSSPGPKHNHNLYNTGQTDQVVKILRQPRELNASPSKDLISTGIKISNPGDFAEREADKAASSVLQSDNSTPDYNPPPFNNKLPEQPIPSFFNNVEAGQSLRPETLAPFENEFGTSLNSVKIHTGPNASQAADNVNAMAFTTGNHIVFGENNFAPETREGCHLLAHELAHVVQGGPGIFRSSQREDPAVELEPGEVIRDANLNYMMGDQTYRLIVYVSLGGTTGHTFVGLKHAITDEVHIRGFYAGCTECDSNIHCSDGEILLMLPGVGHVFGDSGIVCDDSTTSYDTHESFEISESQYDAALLLMHQHQASPPTYVLTNYNCTHFVVEIADTAGVSISLDGVDEPTDLACWICRLRNTCNANQGAGPVLQ